MYQEKPGILELQDSTVSPVRIQNLKKGNVDNTERKKQILEDLKNILPMEKSGIKSIKQIDWELSGGFLFQRSSVMTYVLYHHWIL